MRPSLTSATATSPRAPAGAAFFSHVAKPRVGAAAPSGAVTTTTRFVALLSRRVCRAGFARRRLAVGMIQLPGIRDQGSSRASPSLSYGRITEFFVCLHDCLNQLVSDHVAFVEVNEVDPFDLTDDVHRFHQTR